MSIAPSGFRLTPEEDWVFGVKMRGATLSFGPSGSEVAGAVFAWIMLSVVGVAVASSGSTGTLNGSPVEHPAGMVALGLLACVFGIGMLVASLLAGVRADGNGVVVRRRRRWHRVPWTAIAAVRASEVSDGGGWSWRAGPDALRASMRPPSSSSIAHLVLVDGSAVALPGFVANGRRTGLSLGGATATELKVQALERYRAHAVTVATPVGDDPAITEAARRAARALGPTRWVPVASLVAITVLWLLMSWAAGRLMSPVLLVVALAIGLYALWRERDGA